MEVLNLSIGTFPCIWCTHKQQIPMICFMLIFSSNKFQIRRLDLNFYILVFLESPKKDFSPSIIYNLFFTSDHMNSVHIYQITNIPYWKVYEGKKIFSILLGVAYFSHFILLATINNLCIVVGMDRVLEFTWNNRFNVSYITGLFFFISGHKTHL